MIKPTKGFERFLKRILTRMAEWRVADIMRQTQSLGQVFVEPQGTRNRPPDLRDFEAMGQADAVMVTIGRDKNLRLVAQPPKGDRVDDPVAVTLEYIARAAHVLDRFGVEPP